MVTADGRVITGRLEQQSSDEVTLRTAENQLMRVAARDVESLQKQTTSLMPGDLHRTLKPQGLADLVAYLRELRAPPTATP